jgi:all-trans-retinol dehydrogenase (NAD+)
MHSPRPARRRAAPRAPPPLAGRRGAMARTKRDLRRVAAPSPSPDPAPREEFPPPAEPLVGMVDVFVLLGAALAAGAAGASPAAAALVAGAALAWLARELLMTWGSSMAGETVVITGAGSGIGRLLAHRFAHRHGCKLVLWDLNGEAVRLTGAQCESMGAKVLTASVDVSDWAAVSAAAASAIAHFGQVDCLINNAGIVSGMKLLDVPPALAAKTLDVNLKAHLWTTKALLPGMLERNHGRVVTIASMAGLLGVAGLCDYAASKFGAVGFDESLRMELRSLGKNGVTTTCVCPYYISTGMFTGVAGRWPFSMLFPVLAPAYVADRIAYAVARRQPQLCMPRSGYIVGVFRVLPVGVLDAACDLLGINSSMDGFEQTRAH